MIKIMKTDDTYRRDKEFVDMAFYDCAKITTQSASWVWKDNMVMRYCLILVSDGCVSFRINKKENIILERDTILLLAPNTIVSAKELSSSSTIWMITFECNDFIFFNLSSSYVTAKASSAITPMFYQLNSHVVHRSKPHYYYDSLLMLILDEVNRHIITDENKRQIYDDVCKYISKHVSEELTVGKISDAMNYNKDYLGRIIRECSGSNIKQLIIEEKLTTAKSLLQMTNYSCEKIATLIGLSSANKFVKFFKYHTGESPSEYRNSHQIL
ncbi:MAG: helix-turn-helix domain-containing protein [Clostridia bacterium]|nr:helix-turn-helix domain-containing protein [Clostridia bacterium]